MSSQPISAADPHPRKRLMPKMGGWISYADTGSGDPIVFLQGNPTSSYLWRNIIPHVSDRARCLAPDLIGMGDSGPSASGTYRFVDHTTALDSWFELLGLSKNVTLVVHDWGSALGFHWANRHRTAIKGIAYMEAIVGPRRWDEFSSGAVPYDRSNIFKALRSPAGEEMILQNNLFVETILPRSIIRKLTDEEMTRYRKPFEESGEKRRPTLTWPRDSNRRRAQGCRRDRRGLRRVAEAKPRAEALRQRRPGRDSDGSAARVLPLMAESARGDGYRYPLHPGGFAARNRRRDPRLVHNTDIGAPCLTRRSCSAPRPIRCPSHSRARRSGSWAKTGCAS